MITPHKKKTNKKKTGKKKQLINELNKREKMKNKKKDFAKWLFQKRNKRGLNNTQKIIHD